MDTSLRASNRGVDNKVAAGRAQPKPPEIGHRGHIPAGLGCRQRHLLKVRIHHHQRPIITLTSRADPKQHQRIRLPRQMTGSSEAWLLRPLRCPAGAVMQARRRAYQQVHHIQRRPFRTQRPSTRLAIHRPQVVPHPLEYIRAEQFPRGVIHLELPQNRRGPHPRSRQARTLTAPSCALALPHPEFSLNPPPRTPVRAPEQGCTHTSRTSTTSRVLSWNRHLPGRSSRAPPPPLSTPPARGPRRIRPAPGHLRR